MLLSLLLTVAAAPAPLPQDRPNIVVLVADDLGWRDLGCTGSSFYETPNLDRLAARGTRFPAAYAAAPVCSPSRVALMTGKSPARLDTTDYFGGRRKAALLPAPYHDRLATEERTVAEAFKERGYRTAFLGKWHLGGEGFLPQDQGFDLNVAGCRWGHPFKGYFAPWQIPGLDDSDVPKGTYLTDYLTDRAVDFIGDHEGGEPFLCWLAYYVVHTPLQAPAELRAPYLERREALGYTDDIRWGVEGRRKVRLVQDHATYAAMVAAMDASVGRILAALEEHGLDENTLIVFTSDNGGLSTSEGHPTSNVPARAGKGWLYEGGLRVPMIWRGPGVREGHVANDVAVGTDVFPTLLDLAALPLEPQHHQDGRSLAPALRRDGAGLPKRQLAFHYPHYGNQGASPGSAIRDGDLKLVEWFEDGRRELYDLSTDLGERVDLAAQMPAATRRLSAALEAWRQEVDAKLPSPNPDHKAGGVRRR